VDALFSPLTLPNGTNLPNRLAKAAMEEHLAGPGQLPDERLIRLYRQWGAGGVGLIITGNVMVDARAVTGPAAVVLDHASPLKPFQQWAAAAKSGGAAVWMQLNHPGRQVFADQPGVRLAPSAVALQLGKQSKRFEVPIAMTAADIDALTGRFVLASRTAEEAGFDGVEIHAAHGYLLSQFLSPLTNRRGDKWGGRLENRARALLEIVAAVRGEVKPGFAVAVKLNSADFQRGGFEIDDARRVVELLNGLAVDAVEVSGGSYESPAMQGLPRDGRTIAREAYFLDFARKIVEVAELPVILTGGIADPEVAERVLASGVAIVGMATAMAVTPDLPNKWRAGTTDLPRLKPITWKDKTLASAARQALVRSQLHLLADGRPTKPRRSPGIAFVADHLRRRRKLARYNSWLAGHPVLETGRMTNRSGLRLVGDGLVLREWERGDLAAMVKLFDDSEVAHWTPLVTPFDLDAAKAYLDKAHADNGRIQLAITVDGDEPMGEVLLMTDKATLGYSVGPAFRGQRLAVRALKLLTTYAHEEAGLPRVILEIEPDNAASSGVARSAGYHLTDLPPTIVTDKGREVSLLTWEHLA
jgi:2,4-dienoyl-CoA reductase-like NADH-dependent reductase (Old Yellow Enzyme family)/RimJ/RimL family protein N-acetyltransferase